jgi:hypothetical protein
VDSYPEKIVGEVAGTIRTLFGMTRHRRLSDHLADSLRLYAAAQQYPDLADAASDLAKIVDLQAAKLLTVVTDRPRRWDWPTCIVSLILAAICTAIVWAMSAWWKVTHEGWGIGLELVLAFFTVIFLVVSLQALFQRQSA